MSDRARLFKAIADVDGEVVTDIGFMAEWKTPTKLKITAWEKGVASIIGTHAQIAALLTPSGGISPLTEEERFALESLAAYLADRGALLHNYKHRGGVMGANTVLELAGEANDCERWAHAVRTLVAHLQQKGE